MTFWITPRLGVKAEGELYPPGVIIFNISDLVDGSNDHEKLRRIVREIVRVHEICCDKRIIIECHGGVSRSPTVGAAVLSELRNVTMDDALGFVAHAVPRAQYNYDLVDCLKEALK